MALFDDVRDTVSNVGKGGVSKAREIRDQLNSSVELKNQQRIIEKKYADIGRAYYKKHKKDSRAEYAVLMDEIDAAFAKIQAIKKQQDAFRGIKRCANCGGTIDSLANFCPCCGARCGKDADFMDESAAKQDSSSVDDAVEAEEVEAEVVDESAEEVEEVEAEVVDDIEEVEAEAVDAVEEEKED